MKKTFFLPLVLLFGWCKAQPQSLIYLDESGNVVKAKKASMLIQRLKFSDTLWQFNFYRVGGPMYLCYQSSDENGKIKNGKYITYHSSIRDTAGYYINNRRDGVWNLYTHDLNNRLVFQLTYQTDQLIGKKDSDEVKKEIAYRMDSLKRQMPGTGYEMESRFAGGDHGWQEYLLHSLHYPDEAVDNMIQGAVVIIFVVDKEGNVSDASILRSVEYSLDTESLLIINASSGRWEPAKQNGRKVKSYKKQPIVYKLQVQK